MVTRRLEPAGLGQTLAVQPALLRRPQRRKRGGTPGLVARPDRPLDRRQSAWSWQRLGAVPAVAAHRQLDSVGAGGQYPGTGLAPQSGGPGSLSRPPPGAPSAGQPPVRQRQGADLRRPVLRRSRSRTLAPCGPAPSRPPVAGANSSRWWPLRAQPDVPRHYSQGRAGLAEPGGLCRPFFRWQARGAKLFPSLAKEGWRAAPGWFDTHRRRVARRPNDAGLA